MICWYQPTETYYRSRLIHVCTDNPKTTLCGLEITHAWILWDRNKTEISCKKCARLEKETPK
jgi:hypothetical protein